MKRRSFLFALVAIVGSAVAAGVWRSLRRRSPGPGAREGGGVARELWGSPESTALLLAVANAIVPREGEAPGAGEIDLLARLGPWVELLPQRARFYGQGWPEFERAVREQVRFRGPDPDPESLHAQLADWFASYQAAPRRSPRAYFFEVLRQDVLRVYYSSPEGWAALGYSGPPHRMHPREKAAS